MSTNLRISVLIFVVLLIFVIFLILRKGKLSIKYAILWLFACFIMLLLIIFPNILGFLVKLVGFEVQSNLVFSIFIVILLLINLSVTIMLSSQREKINLLIREVSMLKKQIKNK